MISVGRARFHARYGTTGAGVGFRNRLVLGDRNPLVGSSVSGAGHIINHDTGTCLHAGRLTLTGLQTVCIGCETSRLATDR